MTEITDLSPTDASNTEVTGESLDGAVANMGRMDNTLQAILGMLARSIRTNVFRLIDSSDDTKRVAFDISGVTAGTTRTVTVPDRNGTLALASDIKHPQGYLFGLNLATSGTDAANDIVISSGEASSDGTPTTLLTLASSLIKRIDASWAVGTNQGMLDTGSVANSTYYLWLIKRSDTGVVDVLASLSPSAPTMPANYDLKRIIGQFTRVAGTNGSPSWYGPYGAAPRLWYAAKTDTASTTSSTWADTGLTLTVGALSATSAIKVEALLTGIGGTSGTNVVQFRLVRDSTPISPIGDAAGDRVRVSTEIASSNALGGATTGNTTLVAVDVPGDTSSHVYKVQWQISGGTGYLNRSANDTNAVNYSRTASVIMATEVNKQ